MWRSYSRWLVGTWRPERLLAATPVVVAPGADRGYTTGEGKALALASLAFGIALYWRRKPGGPELKDAGEFFLGVTTDRVLLWTVGVRGAQPTLTQEAPRSSVRSAELRSFEERRGRALTIMVSFRDRSGWALAVARGHADDASQVVENLMAHTPGEA